MTDAAWKSDKRNKNLDKTNFATNKMLALEYRESSFRLALMAPDSLVKSYNNLMQYFFNSSEYSDMTSIVGYATIIELLGNFLIEIRKSMGNESTALNHWDMCEFWMTDAKKLRDGSLEI